MIIALLIAVADVQQSPDDPEEIVCIERDQSQMAMNRCAGDAFERADKALNTQWAKAAALHRGDKPAEQLLRDSQRAWLKYRDAHCELAAHGELGGSIWPLINSSCLAELTRQRTRELGELVSGEGN